jgi:hypothetical protein
MTGTAPAPGPRPAPAEDARAAGPAQTGPRSPAASRQAGSPPPRQLAGFCEAAGETAPAVSGPDPAIGPLRRGRTAAARGDASDHARRGGNPRACQRPARRHDLTVRAAERAPDAPVSARPNRNAEILATTTAVKIVPRRGPNKARIPFTANDIDTNNGEDRQAGLGVTAEITPEAAPPRHARRNSPRTGTPALAAPSPGVQNHASKPRRDRHDIPTATGRSAGRAWNF